MKIRGSSKEKNTTSKYTFVEKYQVVLFGIIFLIILFAVYSFVINPLVDKMTNTNIKLSQTIVPPPESTGRRKTSAPISLYLSKDTVTKDSMRIVLSVTPLINARHIQIELRIPSSLKPSPNPKIWEGALNKGEPKTISTKISLPEQNGYDIIGIARIFSNKGNEVLSKEDVLHIGNKISKPSPLNRKHSQNSKKEKIIEFEVKDK